MILLAGTVLLVFVISTIFGVKLLNKSYAPIPVEEQTNAPVAEIPAEEPGSPAVVEIPASTVVTQAVITNNNLVLDLSFKFGGLRTR